MSEYKLFGDEWEKEMLKFPKKELIKMLGAAHVELLNQWIPVDDKLPDMDEIVFLDNDQFVWIGGRSIVSNNEWLFGNCYGNIWYNRNAGKWEGEIEIDDEYSPVRWHSLPKAPEER